MVAVGPFCSSDDLLYEPLRDLIDLVKRDRPHVLLLMGPFLDSRNQTLQEGDLSYRNPATNEFDYLSYDDVNTHLMRYLRTELARQKTQVVLVPSARDIHFVHPLPQPPYKAVSKDENFWRLGNPSTFRINDITFAVLNAEIIKEICFSMVAKEMPQGKIE